MERRFEHSRCPAFVALVATVMLLAASLLLSALPQPAAAQDGKACPWRISRVQAGKWANGNKKAGLWVKGSFPINIPGVTERPEWFINGQAVGKSQIHFGLRFIPSASRFLRDNAANTITVKFQKPPYNGASDTYGFNFDWSKISPGGYKSF